MHCSSFDRGFRIDRFCPKSSSQKQCILHCISILHFTINLIIAMQVTHFKQFPLCTYTCCIHTTTISVQRLHLASWLYTVVTTIASRSIYTVCYSYSLHSDAMQVNFGSLDLSLMGHQVTGVNKCDLVAMLVEI